MRRDGVNKGLRGLEHTSYEVRLCRLSILALSVNRFYSG